MTRPIPESATTSPTCIAGDVARVEVLQGPQSTLYGSEAIGGVVNVITADATRPFEANLRAEGGSFGDGLRQRRRRRQGRALRLAAGRLFRGREKGIPCFDEESRRAESLRPTTPTGCPGRFRYDITPDLQFDQRAYYSWSRADFDGYDTPTGAFGDDGEYGHTQQWIDYTGLNFSLFDGRLKNRLAFEYNAIDHDNQDPNQPGTTLTFLAHGRTDTIEYEGTVALAPGYRRCSAPRPSAPPWSPVARLRADARPRPRHHQQRLRPDHRRGAVGPDPDRRRALR